MFANTNQEYPILLLKSIGIKNFTKFVEIAAKSDKSICRSLLGYLSSVDFEKRGLFLC